MKNKKYLLAVDSYDMAGAEEKSTQAFYLENGVLSPIKERKDIGIFNLENYVGGGESLDYDLLQVDKEIPVVFISKKLIEKTLFVDVTYSKDELQEDELREAIEKSYLKDCPHTFRDITLFSSLSYSYSISELNEKTADNDFAKRHLEDIAFIESFFRSAEVA